MKKEAEGEGEDLGGIFLLYEEDGDAEGVSSGQIGEGLSSVSDSGARCNRCAGVAQEWERAQRIHDGQCEGRERGGRAAAAAVCGGGGGAAFRRWQERVAE